MSWMDSWCRPSKHAAVPPPLYLTTGQGDTNYCHTCGRVNNSRKTQSTKGNVVKYCSDRCRTHKPGSRDREIEDAIVRLLNGEPDSGIDQTAAKDRVVKGDRRIVVTCDEIEQIVFGPRHDPTKVFGRKKNRATRVLGSDDGEWKSVDMDQSVESPILYQPTEGMKPIVRPSQMESEVNFSVGGERGRQEKLVESDVDLEKRVEGQRKAEEREMVRRAARRGVVFGFQVDQSDTKAGQTAIKRPKGRAAKLAEESEEATQQPQKRQCEAVMNGSVVEPSFAKGDWAIRWRE